MPQAAITIADQGNPQPKPTIDIQFYIMICFSPLKQDLLIVRVTTC
jgi:hypothetical protein